MGGDDSNGSSNNSSPVMPPPPVAPKMSLMDQLMAVSNQAAQAKTAVEAEEDAINKAQTRIRRKSRDLEQEVFGMLYGDAVHCDGVFDEYDKDKSGFIEVDELADALQAALNKLTPATARVEVTGEVVDHFMGLVDTNGDGKISKDEFKMMAGKLKDKGGMKELELSPELKRPGGGTVQTS